MGPTVILKQKAGSLTEAGLARFVSKACRAVGLRGAVTVLGTSDREMQKLNRRFRGKNATTDVLSFPPFTVAEGFAGDIAISLDLAARNAKRFGHSLSEEVHVLVLHGILHLAGYDHEGDDGEMATRESRLRGRLGLPKALIERVAASENGSSNSAEAARNRHGRKKSKAIGTRVRP